MVSNAPNHAPIVDSAESQSISRLNIGVRFLRDAVVGGGGLLAALFFFFANFYSEDYLVLAIVIFNSVSILLLVGSLGIVCTHWRQTGSLSLVAFSLATILVAALTWYAYFLSSNGLATSALVILFCFMAVPAVLGGLVLLDRYVNLQRSTRLANSPMTRLGWKECGTRIAVSITFAWTLLVVVLYACVLGPDLCVRAVSLTWPTTWGEVTDCQDSPVDELSRPAIVDPASIEFRYAVDGIEYQSTDNVSMTAALQSLRDGVSTPMRVQVHYCPQLPHLSILHTGVTALLSMWWMTIVGQVALAIGSGYWLVTFARASLDGSEARLNERASPVESAAMTGILVCILSSKLIIPAGVYYFAGYESRSAAIVGWGLLIAIVWLTTKRVHLKNVRRLAADMPKSGVLVG